MNVSIIIVSWNTEELLKKCIESILRYSQNIEYEIIVVDNASTDNTTEMVTKNFPIVKLIANKKNLGFAKANNQGIQISTGKYVLLLNPDTEFIDESLDRAIEKLTDDNIGVLGCKLLNTDKSIQPSVRRFPRVLDIIAILIKLHKLFPSLLNKYLTKNFNYSHEQEVDQVMGAFFFVPRIVFDKIGLLDEGYFIWFEEVDFCRRAKREGYKVIYFPETQIIHHGSQSFAQAMTWQKQKWFFRSAFRYLTK
jgi:GT2 family glycosyltransferase